MQANQLHKRLQPSQRGRVQIAIEDGSIPVEPWMVPGHRYDVVWDVYENSWKIMPF